MHSGPLGSLVARYLRAPETIDALSEPVILYEPPAPDPNDTGSHQLRTVSGVGAPRIGLGGEPMVLFVRKTKDNAFQRGVTVGRTSNNDLVIDDASVSRFHAWFQQEEQSGTWVVADAGSKNGTLVDGVRLSPRKRVGLPAEAKVKFGAVEVTFFAPQAFMRMIRAKLSNR